jgi:hypothetical protein
MPGVQAEVRTYIDQHHPQLYSDLESSLRGVGPYPPKP